MTYSISWYSDLALRLRLQFLFCCNGLFTGAWLLLISCHDNKLFENIHQIFQGPCSETTKQWGDEKFWVSMHRKELVLNFFISL